MIRALLSYRKPLAGLLGALALLAAFVAVGRWERGRNAAIQNDHMLAVYRSATAQGLDSPLLDRYRLDLRFDCLLYHPRSRPADVSAYELCFDAQGRLVQAIDRSSGSPHFWSLLEQPSLATFRVPVRLLVDTLVVRGASKTDPRLRAWKASMGLPLGIDDVGAFPFSRPAP